MVALYNYYKANLNEIYSMLFCLIALTLLFGKESINSISIIMLLVCWVLDSNKKLESIFDKKYLILYLLFFGVYLYSFLISSNLEVGFKFLKRNLPFLLFPIVLNSLFQKNIKLNWIKIALIASCFIASIYCQINNLLHWQWVNSFSTNDYSLYQYFTHSWFTYGVLTKSLNLQPSFFSLFILVSVIYIVDFFFKRKRKLLYIIIGLGLLLYFTLFLFQLSSRIGIICYFLILIGYFFKLNLNKKYKLIIMLSAIGIFTLIVVNSRFSERFKELATVFKYQKDKGDNSINVKRIRFIAFNAFLEQDLQTKILGAGTGDAQEYLDSYYEKNVIVNSDKYEKKWNIKGLHYHNQFLQNLGESGIFGLAIIMLIVGFSLCFSLKKKKISHSLFIISCILFFLVDSVLIRHKGVVFFSLFNLLFIYEDVLQKKLENGVE